jgi:hypothetical protein
LLHCIYRLVALLGPREMSALSLQSGPFANRKKRPRRGARARLSIYPQVGSLPGLPWRVLGEGVSGVAKRDKRHEQHRFWLCVFVASPYHCRAA